MIDILVTIAALDNNDAAVTLRYSANGYIDGSNRLYEPRLLKSALVSVSPNDGGVLPIFSQASIGDIELINTDGGLDFLADYALDGRNIIISHYDGTTATERFNGTVAGIGYTQNSVIVKIKSPQEALDNNHPANTYAGTNTLPTGIEGTDDDIKGKVKPRVFGDCRNVPAVLVNESLLIYQASDRSDCVITAVYDDGVRLKNFRTNNSTHAQGATSITLTNYEGSISAGAKVIFSNHDTIYTVQTGLAANVIVLQSGLSQSVPAYTALEVVNSFTSTSDLQALNYTVNGDHAIGATVIAATGGTGGIAIGDKVAFSGHTNAWTLYTVTVALSGGTFTIADGLLEAVDSGELIQTPYLWASYNGYFRLNMKPVGTVTCNAISIDGSSITHKAGDVLNEIAIEAGLTLDSASKTALNNIGQIGLFIGDTTTTRSLLDKIAASVAGYYWLVGSMVYVALLDAPAVSAAWTISDYQIIRIERTATGAGQNGLPIYSILAQYDKIETTQTTASGSVSAAWRQRLAKAFREKTLTDDGTIKTRHPLSLSLTIESLLRAASAATSVFTRLFDVVKTRRDVVSVTLPIDAVGGFTIGSTVNLTTPRLGYSAGRNMLLLGYELDDDQHQATLRLFG